MSTPLALDHVRQIPVVYGYDSLNCDGIGEHWPKALVFAHRTLPHTQYAPQFTLSCLFLNDVVDLLTRRGLKKAHSSFHLFAGRFDNEFDKTMSIGDAHIIDAVARLLRCMYADSVLCGKLLERGTFSNLIVLAIPDELSSDI